MIQTIHRPFYYLQIMRWGMGNISDLYIDNLTFLDKDGKVMEIKYDAAANAVDVETDTVKVDEAETPATTTTANEVDQVTDETTTG